MKLGASFGYATMGIYKLLEDTTIHQFELCESSHIEVSRWGATALYIQLHSLIVLAQVFTFYFSSFHLPSFPVSRGIALQVHRYDCVLNWRMRRNCTMKSREIVEMGQVEFWPCFGLVTEAGSCSRQFPWQGGMWWQWLDVWRGDTLKYVSEKARRRGAR